MARPVVVLACALAAGLPLAGCGAQKVDVPRAQAQNYEGATLFKERCSGCHTLDVAASRGSSTNVRTRERNDGPNFNVRCETTDRVLYAIQNGGFSGAIMPQNIVVGREAQIVARFVARYSGQDVENAPAPDEESGLAEGQRTPSRGTTPQENQPLGGGSPSGEECG